MLLAVPPSITVQPEQRTAQDVAPCGSQHRSAHSAVPCSQVEVSPDKVLTIRAERKDERDDNTGQTRRTERQYGVFIRRFQVGTTLQCSSPRLECRCIGPQQQRCE